MSEFMIHDLPCGGGTLALSPLPGRNGPYAVDRDRLLAWDPALVITMTNLGELEQTGAGGLPEDLAGAGIDWRHLPIDDYGVMGAKTAALWPETSALARGLLVKGKRVLVHCFGGCGRSGMVTLRLMIETGEAPEAALTRLRQIRPCAVETPEQMTWAMTGTI